MDVEDTPDTVVPLRPGFDIQLRGFNRNQVIEHIELLEAQLKMVTMDRNEAVALNADLRRLYEETRHELVACQDRLKQIESSNTGLPHAAQWVQNMMAIAEDEIQSLRDQAKRQAEVTHGHAETAARELIDDAESTARALRAECAELAADMETRREQLQRDHSQQLRELRDREQRLRQVIRTEYKRTVTVAQEEADELLAQTQRQCAERDAASEQFRLDVLEETNRQRTQLTELQSRALSMLDQASAVIRESVTVMHNGPAAREPDVAVPGTVRRN